MLKHKIIIKQFKYKQKIREMYGIERVNTMYHEEEDNQDFEDHKSTLQASVSSLDEDIYDFEGYFSESDDHSSRLSYNPYDFYFGDGESQPQDKEPSRIDQINREYREKMTDVGQKPQQQRTVRFAPTVDLKFYKEQSSPIQIKQEEQYELDLTCSPFTV